MLRTSSYTIYVDLPGTAEEMLLVHGYTGAYDRVSRRMATYLRSLESRRPPKPLWGDWSPEPEVEGEVLEPSDEALEILKHRGYLTEMTPEEEEDHLAARAEEIHEHNLRDVPGYIFMPTYDCNLRCSYCFQDHMRTDPSFHHLLRQMSPATADRIFDAIPEIEALHGIEPDDPRPRRVGLFGGEPLLASNRPIVEHIMHRALERFPTLFWTVTNATELEAYEDLVGPGKLAAFQITLDGPPEEHDQRRIYADGSGSFERIARNITLALERGATVSVRLNLDRNNIRDLPELADEIQRQGWDRDPHFSVYTATIRAENEKTDAKSTFSTWEMDRALVELKEEHPQLAVIGRPDDSLKNTARTIFNDQSVESLTYRESFCSAHTGMYIFDAFAHIYACWERTGDAKIRIGDIDAEGHLTLKGATHEMWRSRTVAQSPVCRKCRYALYCGGGCAIMALAKTGNYNMNFCDGFASRFRSSVAEAYLDHVQGVEMEAVEQRVCDQ